MNVARNSLTPDQLATLRTILEQGSRQAANALSKWLDQKSVIEIHALQQQPLAEAVGVLGSDELPLWFGVVSLQGLLTGQMILAFDEASGQKLVETLVGEQSADLAEEELARSAILETTNIVCCAYLNALVASFAKRGLHGEILPAPPEFRQEFAESLMEFALMDQALEADTALVASTRFEVAATRVNWTLLFLPDAESLRKLPQILVDWTHQ